MLYYSVARAHSPGVDPTRRDELIRKEAIREPSAAIFWTSTWPTGAKRILWADRDMPVLARIRERFAEERPLESVRIMPCT